MTSVVPLDLPLRFGCPSSCCTLSPRKLVGHVDNKIVAKPTTTTTTTTLGFYLGSLFFLFPLLFDFFCSWKWFVSLPMTENEQECEMEVEQAGIVSGTAPSLGEGNLSTKQSHRLCSSYLVGHAESPFFCRHSSRYQSSSFRMVDSELGPGCPAPVQIA